MKTIRMELEYDELTLIRTLLTAEHARSLAKPRIDKDDTRVAFAYMTLLTALNKRVQETRLLLLQNMPENEAEHATHIAPQEF